MTRRCLDSRHIVTATGVAAKPNLPVQRLTPLVPTDTLEPSKTHTHTVDSCPDARRTHGSWDTPDYNHRQTALCRRLLCTHLHRRTLGRRQRRDRSQQGDARPLTHPAHHSTLYARIPLILSAHRTARQRPDEGCIMNGSIQPRTLQHATAARSRSRDSHPH
jgi:hypothetical protein